MLEWLQNILKSLIKAKFTGGIQIWFKDGGISSVTRPNGNEKTNKSIFKK